MLRLAATAPMLGERGRAAEAAGEVPAKAGAAIAASPLSVGFETLDRRHFDPEKAYAPLGRLGVKWARVQTGWSRCEVRRGEYDFSWLDGSVDSIRAQGVQPWFNLTYGNKLYAPDSPLESAVGWAPVFDAESRRGWTEFTRRLAEHFRARVSHWEIWNEPDIKVFWKPREPSPEGYADLVKLTAPLIRRAVPKAVIVGGGFAELDDGFDYIEKALAAGMAGHVDRLSYHAYFPRPEAGYRSRVRALQAMANRYKPGLRLWQGESGAPAAQGGVGAMGQLAWNEARQAKWLLRRVLTDLDAGVELSSYFHLVDLVGYREGVPAAAATEKTALFGLLRRDFTPRPSYRAYQCLCTLFDAQTVSADLVADVRPREPAPDGIVTLSFIRKGMPLYAWWRPADLMRENARGEATAAFWSGAQGRMANPVLVDPLTARIRKIGDLVEARGYWRAKALPVEDYPLILTDMSVIG
jgi:hypothetical protein